MSICRMRLLRHSKVATSVASLAQICNLLLSDVATQLVHTLGPLQEILTMSLSGSVGEENMYSCRWPSCSSKARRARRQLWSSSAPVMRGTSRPSHPTAQSDERLTPEPWRRSAARVSTGLSPHRPHRAQRKPSPPSWVQKRRTELVLSRLI